MTYGEEDTNINVVFMVVKIGEAQAIEDGKESPGTEVKSHRDHFCNRQDGSCNPFGANLFDK